MPRIHNRSPRVSRLLATLLAATPLLAQVPMLSEPARADTAVIAPSSAALSSAALSSAAPSSAARLADLIAHVDIPYARFTLKNGLTVLVHTDRKAPIVGVTTYYRVGSKNEPRGRTGFAHLFEHLFFSGSANAPSFDAPLEAAGGSNNGSTWYDRTNYVEVVPTGALPLALFLDSDRMAHLLGALTQDKLDKQRGVVENEKRQDDNQPYGLVGYAIGEGLFPVGHPYRHATIGSMADIDAATLTDVRNWYRDHYAPNNAILVLSGDIDAATAQPLVEKYFGDIAAGPVVTPVSAGPLTLAAPVHREMTDRVANLRLVRAWSGPGVNDPDAPALDVAMTILGGLASSRLDNALVRGQQLAVSVSADVQQHEQIGILTAIMDVKSGVPRATAEAAFDAEIARFLKDGPTQDELTRATTREIAEEIGALEQVGGFGGKGATLAEGLLYSGDPAQYKKDLAAIAALTPVTVRDAARRWLSRPPVMLAVTPGPRSDKGETMGGWGDEATHAPPPVDPKTPVPAVSEGAPRPMPAVTPPSDLAWPRLEHARLSNGIPVTLARRTAIPKVLVQFTFDAGVAADMREAPGRQGLMLAMLSEGTSRGADGKGSPRDATQVLADEERLGAAIGSGETMDSSSFTLSALSVNLAPSLALLGDVLRRPALTQADLDRVRQQRLSALSQTATVPVSVALRSIDPVLFGDHHPYGQPADGLGTADALAAETPATVAGAHDRWLRPDDAEITVVGDTDMAHLLPMLEAQFGSWHAEVPAPARAPLDSALPKPTSRIVLVERPDSPQSMVLAGRVLPLNGHIAPGADAAATQRTQDALSLANAVLGNDFLSRLNSDLREDKAWSYGVESILRQPLGPRSLLVLAPVETDHTGDAIARIIADMKAFPAAKPVTPAERTRAVDGNIRALPTKFETGAALLSAILVNQRLGRPEDYDATLPGRWRAISDTDIDAAAKTFLQPEGLVFVVVGDAAKVAPQLGALGLPVERVAAPAAVTAKP